MKPAVSVIIPTYNHGRFIERAIDSVLVQGVPCEVIVIDDGSTDDTQERLVRYGDRIRVVRQPNRGLAATRNAGIGMATADLIAFLDADDEWLPGKLVRQIATLDAHPEIALVSGNAENVDENGNSLGRGSASLHGNVVKELLRLNAIVVSSVVIRRSVATEIDGPFIQDFSSCEDWILWLRVAARHPIVVLPDVLVRYSIMPGSMARSNRARYKMAFATLRALEISDPVLGPFLASQKRYLRVADLFWQSVIDNEAGRTRRARAGMLRAIIAGPWYVKWSTALSILFLSPRLRTAIVRWLTRRK